MSREFHLAEIDAWRAGERATPGCPMDGERYPLRMREAIKHHDRALAALDAPAAEPSPEPPPTCADCWHLYRGRCLGGEHVFERREPGDSACESLDMVAPARRAGPMEPPSCPAGASSAQSRPRVRCIPATTPGAPP